MTSGTSDLYLRSGGEGRGGNEGRNESGKGNEVGAEPEAYPPLPASCRATKTRRSAGALRTFL